MRYISCGDYSIPILEGDEIITDEYIRLLEVAIKSDGCTVVSELHHGCCVIHDLGYGFGIDVRGNCIDRRTTDANFRRCMQTRSFLAKGSPVAVGRWLGVRLFGRWFKKSKADCGCKG